MEGTELIHIDFTSGSGQKFKGDFTVKTSITRSDRFTADRIRREVIGPCPDGTPPLPALQTEAFILGQLTVRIVKAPPFWKTSDNGMDLEESDVIFYIYDKVLELDEKKNRSLKKESDKALKKLAKKIEEEDDE